MLDTRNTTNDNHTYCIHTISERNNKEEQVKQLHTYCVHTAYTRRTMAMTNEKIRVR